MGENRRETDPQREENLSQAKLSEDVEFPITGGLPIVAREPHVRVCCTGNVQLNGRVRQDGFKDSPCYMQNSSRCREEGWGWSGKRGQERNKGSWNARTF